MAYVRGNSAIESENRALGNNDKACSPAFKWCVIMLVATGVAFGCGIGGAFALHKTGILGSSSYRTPRLEPKTR